MEKTPVKCDVCGAHEALYEDTEVGGLLCSDCWDNDNAEEDD